MQNPLAPAVLSILLHDLKTLEAEIRGYEAEANLWQVVPGTANSAGNLCLHLCGNLQHFVGAILGGSGYQRNRDLEFSRKDVSRSELLLEIEKTSQVVAQTLSLLPEESVQSPYPAKALKEEVSTGYFLIHLAAHLNYHLGQINYHRRMLNKN